MLFTNEIIQQCVELHCGKLPGAVLSLLVDTITDILETAFDLRLKYPEIIRFSVSTFKEECVDSMQEIDNYSFDLKKRYFCDLARKNEDSVFENFLKNSCRIRQIASGNLSSFELYKMDIYLNLAQKREAQEILLYFLDLTLKKMQELDNEKNYSDSAATTARLSESSQERSSFDEEQKSFCSSSQLFQKNSEEDKKNECAKCECL